MVDGSLIAFVVGGALLIAFNSGIAWYMTLSNKKKVEKLETRVDNHLSESNVIQRELAELRTGMDYMREDVREVKSDIKELKNTVNQANSYINN